MGRRGGRWGSVLVIFSGEGGARERGEVEGCALGLWIERRSSGPWEQRRWRLWLVGGAKPGRWSEAGEDLDRVRSGWSDAENEGGREAGWLGMDPEGDLVEWRRQRI